MMLCVPSLIPPAMAAGSLRRSPHPSVPVGAIAVLRPWLLSDADAVVDAFCDPEIQRWHVRRADSVDEAWQWITGWKAGWADEAQLNWALVDRASDSLMGRVSLKGVDFHDGSAGVAYWMVPAWRGRGLCSQAVLALCQWAFNEAGFHRIGLAHSVANLASCRVAAKAGFRVEGIRQDAALHADGWHDMHVHALLADQAPRSSEIRGQPSGVLTSSSCTSISQSE
jgi:RimJ/RimL family protein N-acetyltransferase